MSAQHTMSPDLIAFLKAWYDWATSGAPDRDPFWRMAGLCACVEDIYRSAEKEKAVQDELEALFGGEDYPFGRDDYAKRERNRTQHECPKRLAWVRERLIEAGELVA